MRKLRMILLLAPLVLSVFFLFMSTPIVAAQEEWEGVGLDWYYDNLTETDRKKIRQAFDYSIPREQVIEGLMKGLAIPLATEVGTNMAGYDPSIQPREFNYTKALALMTEVFGKEYNPDAAPDDPDTYTDVPYFSMTIIAPTTNVARTQWAAMTALAFQDIGVDVELKWWNWNIIMPRLFLDPVGIGYNYEHGGFDGYFIGFGATADPDYSGQYYVESFAPAGDNSMWVERPDFVDIINASLSSPDLADRLDALADYQAWFYEWVPKSIIRQALDTFPQDPDWVGFDTYNYGRYPWVHNMTYIGGGTAPTSYTSIVPGDYVDFNPMISNSWYDSVVTSNYHLSLSGRRGIYNLTHPVPQAASGWTASADGLVWTVDINTDLKFSDGSSLTADDVIASYVAAYDAPASTWAGDMTTWFNSTDDIEKVDADTVKFTLQLFYPYVESAVFGIPIFKKAQLDSIGLDNLKTDDTNTGAAVMHGLGPYMMDIDYTNGPNGLPSTVKSIKNPYYDGAKAGHDPTMPGGGYFMDNVGPESYYTTVVKDALTAVSGLQSGTYDLFDPNVGIFGLLEQLEAGEVAADPWVTIITAPEYGWQELAYNHYDPRWGLNPHDPREMYPEDYEEAPLELLPILLSLFAIAAFQLIRRRRK